MKYILFSTLFLLVTCSHREFSFEDKKPITGIISLIKSTESEIINQLDFMVYTCSPDDIKELIIKTPYKTNTYTYEPPIPSTTVKFFQYLFTNTNTTGYFPIEVEMISGAEKSLISNFNQTLYPAKSHFEIKSKPSLEMGAPWSGNIVIDIKNTGAVPQKITLRNMNTSVEISRNISTFGEHIFNISDVVSDSTVVIQYTFGIQVQSKHSIDSSEFFKIP